MEVRLSRQVNLEETCKSGSLHCPAASTKFFSILGSGLGETIRKLSVFCPCSVI
jgi:hypothetical protein